MPAYKKSPERDFGLALSVFLGVMGGLVPLLRHRPMRPAALLLAGLALSLALVRPEALRLAARASSRLGERISRVTTPVLMTILYLLVFTPVSLALRAVRRRARSSTGVPAGAAGGDRGYWLARTDRRAWAENLKRQF